MAVARVSTATCPANDSERFETDRCCTPGPRIRNRNSGLRSRRITSISSFQTPPRFCISLERLDSPLSLFDLKPLDAVCVSSAPGFPPPPLPFPSPTTRFRLQSGAFQETPPKVAFAPRLLRRAMKVAPVSKAFSRLPSLPSLPPPPVGQRRRAICATLSSTSTAVLLLLLLLPL